MKREIKVTYAHLRQVGEWVKAVQYALEELEEGAERFAGLLGEQESEAVRVLLEGRWPLLKAEIRDYREGLEELYELLACYITEMTEAVRPVKEEQETVVDRNDIWWNMKQICGNIEESHAIARGIALLGYQKETQVWEPQIREEMEAEEISALWEAYHRALRERENRRENYRKLEGFCSGEAREAKERLEGLYEEIERIYRNHVVVYENTDDAYKREAEALYNRYSSREERRLRAGKSIGRGAVSVLEGAGNAVWDTAKGIGSLVVFTGKSLAAGSALLTESVGLSGGWLEELRQEVGETYKGVGRALQNPGRVLAAIGQGATDTLEEKGIAYGGSYVITDLALGIALDRGVGKLGKAGKANKLVNKLDEVGDAGKALNEIGEAVIRYGDEVGEAAVKRGLDSNLLDELANSGVKYNPEDIVAITKTADGKLVWLENGTDTAGLNHIITEHADDFLNKGITQEQISDYVMNALENGKIVGYQGRGTGRPIYEFTYNGEIHEVAITVGNNGFIVGANPK